MHVLKRLKQWVNVLKSNSLTALIIKRCNQFLLVDYWALYNSLSSFVHRWQYRAGCQSSSHWGNPLWVVVVVVAAAAVFLILKYCIVGYRKPMFHYYYFYYCYRQEIWANAHEMRESLWQFLFANCQSISSHFVAVHSWSVCCNWRSQKSIKTPYFGSSVSFKVIDVGTIEKLIT